MFWNKVFKPTLVSTSTWHDEANCAKSCLGKQAERQCYRFSQSVLTPSICRHYFCIQVLYAYVFLLNKKGTISATE